MSVQTEYTVLVKNFQFNDLSGDGHFVEEPNGYRNYGDIMVNKNGGSLISKGSFSAIEVYCEPTNWLPGTWSGWKGDYKVLTPLGLKDGENPNQFVGTSSQYTYPDANRLGVVVLQRNDSDPNSEVTYHQVTGTSEGNAQRITLNGQKNIYVAINDQSGENNYADNSGSFRIHIKLIA